METLPATVTAQGQANPGQMPEIAAQGSSFRIGTFNFGNAGPDNSEGTLSAARDQAELEAACQADEQQAASAFDNSPTSEGSQPDAEIEQAAGPGHVSPVNPVIAKLRPSVQQKALKTHATMSFRHKLADKAFQMGSGPDNGEKTFMKALVEKLAAAGLKPPTIMLEYDSINVEADALVGSANIPSLSNVFMGTFKVKPYLTCIHVVVQGCAEP